MWGIETDKEVGKVVWEKEKIRVKKGEVRTPTMENLTSSSMHNIALFFYPFSPTKQTYH